MNIRGVGKIQRSQRLLLIFLVTLIVVAEVQVQWWLYDGWKYSASVQEQLQSIHDGRTVVDDPLLAASQDAREKRATRYAWEGAFFLSVLTACLAGAWRSLRAEMLTRRRQDTFLALVSHQFKTPLASLKVAVETLLLRGQLPAHLESIVGRAVDDVQRLEDLIGNILESARLDEGRVKLRRDSLPLARIVAQTLDRLSDRARRVGVEFETDIPRELHALADPVAADAVLRNLLENAVTSMASLGRGTVRVSAREAGDHVELEIHDTGVGFEPRQAKLLFEKFGSSDSPYHAGERTGLGLYIAQHLMLLGGGSIRAHSDGPGRGASFFVLWPRADGAAP
jgi:signal transduction histidine kinase